MIKQVCCKWCGNQFYATSRGEYCSGKCRVAAHRAKKKEVDDANTANKRGSKKRA